MKLSSVVATLVFLTILSGCQSLIEGNGEPVQESRVLESFELLRLECPADVVIHPGKSGEPPKVVVRVEENLLPYILTTVDDPKLIIDFKENFSSKSGVTIDVYNAGLMKIINGGSGSITSAEAYKCEDIIFSNEGSGDIVFEVKCDDVRATNGGSGDVTLRGKCDRARYTLGGSGDIDARGLRANEVNCQNEGSGTLAVYAKKELDAALEASGDIKYIFKGTSDDKDLEQDGSGQLIELSE